MSRRVGRVGEDGAEVSGTSRLVPPAGASDLRSAASNIKGNVSLSAGICHYYMPGDRDCQRTRISTAHGEWWFCSELAARAAGWLLLGS